MSTNERRPAVNGAAESVGGTTDTVARERAERLIEGLRRGSTGRARPGCPCGCRTRPGQFDDAGCVRFAVRPASRRAVEVVADHFAGVGMLREVREILGGRWQEAS